MDKILIFKVLLNYPDGSLGLDCVPELIDEIHNYSMIEDSITKTFYEYRKGSNKNFAPDFWIDFQVSVSVDTEDMNSEWSLFKYGVLEKIRETDNALSFSYECYLVDNYEIGKNGFIFNKKKSERIDLDKIEVKEED